MGCTRLEREGRVRHNNTHQCQTRSASHIRAFLAHVRSRKPFQPPDLSSAIVIEHCVAERGVSFATSAIPPTLLPIPATPNHVRHNILALVTARVISQHPFLIGRLIKRLQPRTARWGRVIHKISRGVAGPKYRGRHVRNSCLVKVAAATRN